MSAHEMTNQGDPMMNGQVPRVGVVGCGYWGRNLVRNFHTLGSLEAVCEVDESRLQETAKEFGVRAIRDFDALLKIPEIQGVVIATPAVQHFALVRRALLSGKEVFVEKPI